MKLVRPLDPVEIRVLGSLLEKQQATPEYYPLTINALIAACNQKTNREPVMELHEEATVAALDRLQHEVLVWKVMGGRTVHWEHNLDKKWLLDPPAKAIMTLLLLRGPQTAGELRTRSDRLFVFGALEEVEGRLRAMTAEEEPLVGELPRRPGQKESRWAHRAGGSVTSGDTELLAVSETPSGLSERVTRLESEVSDLRDALAKLKEKLGEP